jgi:hypothetical protein
MPIVQVCISKHSWPQRCTYPNKNQPW